MNDEVRIPFFPETHNATAQGRQTVRGKQPGNIARLFAEHWLRKTAALFAVPCSRLLALLFPVLVWIIQNL